MYLRLKLCFDHTGNGTAVEHELLHLDKFKQNLFDNRLMGINFGGTTIIGEDNSGKPVKVKTKEHMTVLINKMLYSRKLKLPKQDNEVEDQLCTHTFTKGERGIIYSQGNDHIIDAMRCAFLCRNKNVNSIQYEFDTFLPEICIVHTDPIFY